jgi:hypothetical protein
MLWTVRKRIELRTTAWESGALTYEPPLLEERLSNCTISICMKVARSNTKKSYITFYRTIFRSFFYKKPRRSISTLLFSCFLQSYASSTALPPPSCELECLSGRQNTIESAPLWGTDLRPQGQFLANIAREDWLRNVKHHLTGR